MGATVGSLYLRGVNSGRKYTVSVYFAGGDAVGAYILTDYNSPAAATSPNFFTVPELCDVIDFIPTSATGTLEFTSDGLRTGVTVNLASFGATNQGRPVGTLPRLAPNKTYRLLVTVACAA
jgi:hypothetical protein